MKEILTGNAFNEEYTNIKNDNKIELDKFQKKSFKDRIIISSENP
jgi:hypothetical protein